MINMIAVWILLGISHLLSFWAMTEPRYSAKKTVLIYSMFCAAFVCTIVLFYAAFGDSTAFYAAAFSATIAAAFFVFALTSADPLCKKIFLFISYADVFCVFVCVSLILCSIFFKNSAEIVVYYARNIIRTVLFIAAVFVYIRFLRPTVRSVSGKHRRAWYSISGVSVLFLIIFSLCLVEFHSDYEHIGRYIPYFAAAVLLYASILWVIFGTIESMIKESDAELIQRNIAYLETQLKTARENELTAKTVRHDFRHHNRNITAMLEKGDIEGAMKYLDKYNDSLRGGATSAFCPNATVNAILNNFCARAKMRGISVSAEADTGENTPIADIDFVAVLSNLLENAVNGCMECGADGGVKVNIRTVAEKTVIVCSNPCREDICIENNMVKNRGIGIASMVAAIRKYNGDIRYSFDSGVLTACVILNSMD